jgi:hypothetical protein
VCRGKRLAALINGRVKTSIDGVREVALIKQLAAAMASCLTFKKEASGAHRLGGREVLPYHPTKKKRQTEPP